MLPELQGDCIRWEITSQTSKLGDHSSERNVTNTARYPASLTPIQEFKFVQPPWLQFAIAKFATPDYFTDEWSFRFDTIEVDRQNESYYR